VTLSFSPRLLIGALLVIVLACVPLGLWHFQPKRQALLTWERLLRTVEKRDWVAVSGMMAEDYRDAWGQTRTEAVTRGSEGLAQFFWITINPEKSTWEFGPGRASVSARLQMDGHGTPLAQMAVDRFNQLKKDFQFAFRKESWKPWDWKLVSISQPEIPGPPIDHLP
jgi:hypothetical protein